MRTNKRLRLHRCVAPRYAGQDLVLVYPVYGADEDTIRARVPHPEGGSAVYDLRVLALRDPSGFIAETEEVDDEGRRIWRRVG